MEKETKTAEELFEDASKKGLKIVFGLEAQGHIPTIQAELRRWNDSYIEQFPDEEPLDMSYSRHVWERIGKIIGWCPFTASLHYFQWLKLNELTQQQEINADLQKRLSEAESAIEGSDIKIYDLKNQNAELVHALKESLIDQNARYNILMIKALNSNEQNPEKTMYGEEAKSVLKRMKATQKLLENTPPKN